MMFRIQFLIILVFSLTNIFVLGADPCFDHGPDPATGNYAICVQQDSCLTEPVATDACPSYPSDYSCCYHKTFPGREHRGAWIASVTNIDWPTSPGSSDQQQQLEFIISQIAEAGFNAIYLQVRPAGDALYASDIEPWSIYLTGSPQGVAPSPFWDPLEYAIQFCKPLNIEVHAWINPYRARLSPIANGLASNHMAVQFPQYAYPFDSYLWMDPGSVEVQNRTYSVALDLVTRYDLDGLHMDDYFYPYPVTGVTFGDQNTYAAYLASGGELDLGDWRRDNVNKLIQRMNTGIHEVKPWVKFSISPFGIFRAGHPEGMPPPIAGFDQYSEIYCDAKKWLQEGWMDILQPQLYWRIDPPAQSYPVLLDWWVAETQNPKLRHVYAGQYLSRVEIDDWPITEIRNQIDFSRVPANRLRGSWGNVQFSAKMLRDDYEGMVGFFKGFIYPLPALQPVFPWLSNATFMAVESMTPQIILSAINQRSVKIDIDVTDKGMVNSLPGVVHNVAIYRENDQGQWTLFKIIHADGMNQSIQVNGLSTGHYAVSFVNRVGQESQKAFFTLE